MKTKTLKKNKVNVVTLGCSKNTFDSEVMMAQLKANNFEVEHESLEDDAEIVIINTCGFIDNAKQESIDTIDEIESNVPASGHIEWVAHEGMTIPNEWNGKTEFIDMFLEILNDPIRPQNRHKSTTGFRVYGSENKLRNWLKGTK